MWKGSLDRNRKISYCLIQEFPIDDSIGHFTFSDIDRNGYVDIIFPIFEGTSFSLGISYNQASTDVKLDEEYCDLVKGTTTVFSTIDNSTNNLTTQMIITSKQLFLDNYTIYRDNDIFLQPIIRVGIILINKGILMLIPTQIFYLLLRILSIIPENQLCY